MAWSVGLAEPKDADAISNVLMEAVQWRAAHLRRVLWDTSKLGADVVEQLIARNEFIAVREGDQLVGVMTLQWRDLQFWPDRDDGQAGYLHKIAVRRAWAGRNVPAAMIAWAEQWALDQGRALLRLDCEPHPKLLAIYAELGFVAIDDFEASERGERFWVKRHEKRLADRQ
jgi:GNAT superfamily N-acetyltransferase